MSKTETGTLEQYRVALQNAKDQPQIAAEMAELGYTNGKIEEGEQLLAATRQSYDFKQQEDNETSAASATFKAEKEKLDKSYGRHRKKAKTKFRKDPETLKKLKVDGKKARLYPSWIGGIKAFYQQIGGRPAIAANIAVPQGHRSRCHRRIGTGKSCGKCQGSIPARSGGVARRDPTKRCGL